MKIGDFETAATLREGVKRDLDTLEPGVMLSTTEMVNWFMEKSGATPETQFMAKLIYDAVRNKPRERFRGYTTPGKPKISTSNYTRGKMITPTLWHRFDPAAVAEDAKPTTPACPYCPHCQAGDSK